MMKDYGHYVHKRALCHALPNIKQYQPIIVNTLMTDAEAGLLESLTIDSVAGTDAITITFKYRTDTTLQVLNAEDLLVVYLDGTKTTFTPEEFAATYQHYEGAFADCAITDKTKLSV